MTIIRILIVGAVIAVILYKVNLPRLKDVLLKIDFWAFAIAMTGFFVGQGLVSLRWWLMLGGQHIPIPFWATFKLHYLSLFYNNVLPSAFGGDLVKAWYVTSHTEKRWQAVLSIVADRAIGVICMFILSGGAYLMLLRMGGEIEVSFPNFTGPGVKTYSIFFAVVCLFFAVFALSLFSCSLRSLYLKLLTSFRSRVKEAFSKVFQAVRLYLSKPGRLLVAAVLTFLCQITPVLGYYIVGLNMGVDIPLKVFLIAFPLSWMLGVIPVSPGAAGVMEGGVVLLLTQLSNASSEEALALALIQRAAILLGSLAGGMVHLTGGHLPSKDELIAQGSKSMENIEPEQPLNED